MGFWGFGEILPKAAFGVTFLGESESAENQPSAAPIIIVAIYL